MSDLLRQIQLRNQLRQSGREEGQRVLKSAMDRVDPEVLLKWRPGLVQREVDVHGRHGVYRAKRWYSAGAVPKDEKKKEEPAKEDVGLPKDEPAAGYNKRITELVSAGKSVHEAHHTIEKEHGKLINFSPKVVEWAEKHKGTKKEVATKEKEGHGLKYTGDVTKDFLDAATQMHVIADTVAEKRGLRGEDKTKLSSHLNTRMREIYKNNEKFGKELISLENGKTGARDKVYMWMNHWADAYQKEGPAKAEAPKKEPLKTSLGRFQMFNTKDGGFGIKDMVEGKVVHEGKDKDAVRKVADKMNEEKGDISAANKEKKPGPEMRETKPQSSKYGKKWHERMGISKEDYDKLSSKEKVEKIREVAKKERLAEPPPGFGVNHSAGDYTTEDGINISRTPKLGKFANLGMPTRQGDLTDGRWMLKKEFVDDKLMAEAKKRAHYKADWDNLASEENPDGSVIWPDLKEYEEVDSHPHSVIGGGFDAYEFHREGGDIRLSKTYFDYLSKKVPNFSMRADKTKGDVRPIAIMSGDKLAGVLMPMKAGYYGMGSAEDIHAGVFKIKGKVGASTK